MKLVLVSGKAESGKTEFSNHLKDSLCNIGYECQIVSFADCLKFWAQAYFGWNGVKNQDGRETLQRLGTDIARNKNPDVWVKIIHEFLITFEDIFDFIIVDDARFENEISYFKDSLEGVLTIRIERPNHISKLTMEQLLHPSETDLDDWEFDSVYYNSSDIEDMVFDIKDMVALDGFFTGNVWSSLSSV